MTIRASATFLLGASLLFAGCSASFSTEGDAETSATTASDAASPAITDEDKTAAEQVIRDIYASYNRQDTSRTPTSWEQPVFSAELTALIATIPRPEGEVGPLSDADWFCNCQDWDPATAGITELSSAVRPDGKVVVSSTFQAMTDADPARIDFLMVREGGSWKVDDMLTPGAGTTLRGDITAAVAEAAGG
jgi:hypothetical protein